MKNNILIIVSMTVLFSFNSCLKEESLNLKYAGFIPEELGDGWEISDPELVNMDNTVLDKLYRDFFNGDKYPNIRSLLIVRNGKLVSEAYCKKESDRDQMHHIMSATKSITSILTGIALEDGLLKTIDTAVYSYLPQYFDGDVRKREITLRNVLTMETGLNFDDEIHSSEMINYKGSSLEYVLHQDLVFKPGEDWYYGNGNPQLMSGIISLLSGNSMAEYADEKLFKPLGIYNNTWESHHDGLTMGAIGLWLTPRDMAKIGWLMANEGEWNGNSIVSKDWVKESTIKHSEFQDYGFYWKLFDLGFYAEGHGGQLILVCPDKALVVVITSDSYASTYLLSSPYGDLCSAAISSVID